MNEICGDNRFEIIAKAKAHLLDATNIDASEDEMKVLDSFLFRCWQMGWLDRYDHKTEPTTEDCDYCKMTHKYWYEHCGCCEHKPKDEPTISKMEQVEDEPKTQMKTQNSNLTFEKADEPQIDCGTCKHHYGKDHYDIDCERLAFGSECRYEPQTDCAWK